jgi:PIN domain nuclease of toxin-antitoxin system
MRLLLGTHVFLWYISADAQVSAYPVTQLEGR